MRVLLWSNQPVASRPRLRVVLALALVLGGGLVLRQVTWEFTAPARHRGDLRSAYKAGERARTEGYFQLYDRIVERGGRIELDYAPLRLLVMAQWARWVTARHDRNPLASAAVAPLRALNLAAELIAAVGLGFLVRLWVSRSAGTTGILPAWPAGRDRLGSPLDGDPASTGAPDSAVRRRDRRARALGVAVAVVFWLNPAMILSAHGFPQWDVWALPFFVLAALLASRDAWVGAGILVAVGSLLKAQLLLVAPLLVLWPVFAGRLADAGRWTLGFAVGIATITSPWLVRRGPAAIWVAGVLAAGLLLWRWGTGWRLTATWWAAVLVAAGLLAWPWLLTDRPVGLLPGLVLAAGAVVGAQRIGGHAPGLVAAGALVTALLVAALAFDGSFAWAEVGIVHGIERFHPLARRHVANLPAVLVTHFGFGAGDTLLTFRIPGTRPDRIWSLTIESLLACGFGLALTLCGYAVALQARRREARVLVALTAAWVLLFVLLPRMHTRHLMWGAALSAVGLAVGVGPLLVHAGITAIAWAMMLHTMLGTRRLPVPEPVRWLSQPAVGGLLVLAAGYLLYLALAPRRR
jgi:hypothetical protein